MRRAGAGLIAAVLALAGCKSADTKSGDDKSPAGVAARNKAKDGKDTKDKDRDSSAVAKGPTWLDDVSKLPGAGTGVPKAGPYTNPTDPNYNAKNEAQDAIGGRVFDPNGKPARNVFVRIDAVGAPPGGPAALGIYTDNNGYFFTRGLKPGKAYDLTAEATPQDGKALTGIVQTKVPNPTLTIVLRDDLPATAGGLPPPRGPSETFPPTPKPNDKVGEIAPPTAVVPTPPKPPIDGAWAPGGSVTGVPPSTIGGSGAAPKPPAGGGVLPPPDDISFPPPGSPAVKPENVADGPKDKFKPPVVNIPGPSGPPPGPPPVPKLPPLDPSSPNGGRSSMGTTTGGAPGKFALVDTLERPWDLDSVKPGTLVLVEFMSSTCEHCPKVIPILKDLQSRYGASGLQLAGVLCDDLPLSERAATAARYGRDNNLNYALYVEPGRAGSVRDGYDIQRYPTAMLLNSAGKVLWKGHPGERAELESAIKQNLGK